MPSQTINSTIKTKLPPVTLLNAGERQFIICAGSTIFLEAEVDDPLNLPGHTIEWEQIAGNSVVFDTPNQIATTYPASDVTDKTFRCWIDRGTIFEQYKDVVVYRTPTDYAHSGSMKSKVNDHSDVTIYPTEISVSILAPDPIGTVVPEVTGPIGVKIVYAGPSLSIVNQYSQKLLRNEFWHKSDIYSSSYIYNGEITPEDATNKYYGPSGYYIMRSVFAQAHPGLDGQTAEVYYDSDIVRARPISEDAIQWMSDDVCSKFSAGSTGEVSIVRYGNIQFRAPDDGVAFGGMAPSNITSIARFGNIQVDAGIDSNTIGGLERSTSINITRFNNSGIGGGSD